MEIGTGLLPGELPIQPTPLLGREIEVAEVVALFGQSGTRVVTLTGPGGIGKSRLAVAVAEQLKAVYADAARFIPLAPIRDPALVVPTIAQALGVREIAGLSPRDGLAARLGGTPWLLVLDNFEQVRDAAADIAWLLATCPGLRTLVTSRARLQIRGEHEYALAPLPLPDPRAGPRPADPPDQLAAVQLFLQRARDVVPDLTLTGATGPIVLEICRRLDGLPLAIELAAARIKILPPATMLVRLERRLSLLTGGARDLPDRHRTMRDAVAWSYDLLPPPEQALFRQLCVCAGGFTLHQAESIALAGGRGVRFDPIEGLANLVDHSLLRQQEQDGEPRFAMLETVREYGLEVLAETGELEAARDRHADFFVSFAEAAHLHLRGGARSSWLARFEHAHDNLRAALAWLRETGDTPRATRLGGALWQFWWWRSHLAEGRQRLDEILALPGVQDQGVAYARVLTGCGALSETQGDYAAADRYHAAAADAWRDLDDPRGLALTLLFRWLVAFNAGDAVQMAGFAGQSLRLFQSVDDPWGVAMSRMEQGVLAMLHGEHATGERALGDAIDGFQSINDAWGVAISRGAIGNIRTDMGDYEAADRILRDSLSTLVVLDDLWGLATVLPASARSAAEQGDFERAVRLSGAFQQINLTLGTPMRVPFRDRYERNTAAAIEHLGAGRVDELMAEGAAITPLEAVAIATAPAAPAAAPAEPDVPAQPITVPPNRLDEIAFTLSPREREVLRLVPGRTAKEIGEALYIAESTVRTHIEHILAKLGLRNQKELVAFVYERRVV